MTPDRLEGLESSDVEFDETELDRLIDLDEDSDVVADVEPPADDTVALTNCLALFQRVRHHSPHCVVDLLSDLDETHDAEEAPSQLGRFEIIRRLGSGGFGVVFLALDPNLDRLVALKIPRVETLINTATRQRFVREAKMAARVKHPNVATILEAGFIGPILYICSEHYTGGTLVDFLEQMEPPGRLDPRTACETMAGVAHAIQAAHEQGVLHRDIKPSNILLDFDSELELSAAQRMSELPGAARLVDFGLAKCLDASTDDTRSGLVIGTPAYTAPELIQGSATPATAAADVYALGATLYHLLCGRPPLQKETPFETMLAAQNEVPVAPSRIVPSIPWELDAICLRCLEKDPKKRYVRAADLASDLERFLAGQPVSVRVRTASERFLRWCSHQTMLVNIGLTVAAGLAFTLLSVFWSMQTVQSQRRVAKLLEGQISTLNERSVYEQARRVIGFRRITRGNDDFMEHQTLAISFDGSMIALGLADEVRLLDLFTGEQLAVLPIRSQQLGFLHNDRALVAVGIDGVVEELPLRRVRSNEGIEVFVRPTKTHDALADPSVRVWKLAPDGNFVGMIRDNGIAAVADLTTFTQITLGLPPIQDLAIAPECRWIAGMTPSGQVFICDGVTGYGQRDLGTTDVRRAVFSPNARLLATATDKSCQIWDTGTWKRLWSLELSKVHDIAFSSASTVLAVATADNRIHLFSTSSGERVTTIEMPAEKQLDSITFAPGASQLVAQSTDGLIHVWNLDDVRKELGQVGIDWKLGPMPVTSIDATWQRIRVHVTP